MKKVSLLALLAILTLAAGNSEIVAIKPSSSSDPQTFFDAVGGRGLDFAYSITQPDESGHFAVVGPWDYTRVFDAFIAKLDSSGSVQWARALGGPRVDTSLTVIETSDGGYVMAGETRRGAGGGDLFIAKFASNGDYQWGTAVGGPGWERALSVIETQDRGFVVTGLTTSFGAVGWDLFIAKFDHSGSFLWAKRLGGAGNEVGSSVIEVIEDQINNLFVTGWTTNFGTMDILLAKFSPAGNPLWVKVFGAGFQDDVGDSLYCRAHSDLFVTGWTKGFGAGNQDVFIAKFDLKGNVIWAKTLGGTYDDRGHSVIVTLPHPVSPVHVTVTGSTKSFGAGGEDVLLATFDLDGNFKWARTVGGPANEGGFSVKQALITIGPFTLPSGRLFVAGYTYSWGTGRQDALLATFDPYGYTYPPVNVVHNPTVRDIPISPLLRGDIPSAAVAVTPSVFSIPSTAIYSPPLSRTQLRRPPLVEYTDIGPPTNPVAFSFAIIADNHLHHTTTLPTVIDWINDNRTREDIRFVVLLGDITDETKGPDGRRYSCVRRHLEDVRDLLETLEVPYIPVIGNHDVWYDYGNDNLQPWWEKRPEEIFNDVFGPHIANLPSLLPGLSNWRKAPTPISAQPQNAPGHVDNYFQNFAFDYEGYHFIFLDFVSRSDPYTSNETDMNRGWPDLQQWAGANGTWGWFTRHLDNYVKTSTASENILIFAHHPLSFSYAGLSAWFPLAFKRVDYEAIARYFANNGYHHKLAKWFAGHFHIPVEEDITDDPHNNTGDPILQTVTTASVSAWAPDPLKRNPYAPALRVVRVRR